MFTRIRTAIAAAYRSLTWDQAAAVGLVNRPTAAGVPVTVETALTNSPVFAAVKVISSAIASLPLTVYRREPDGGRERADDHPAFELLHDAPNPESDPAVWWAAFVAQVLLHGNGFAEIERDGAGRPLALWLIPSTAVKIRTDGGLWYEVLTATGPVPLEPDMMFHVPYFSLDGVTGRGVIEYARETIGLNKAMEVGAAAQFANMTRPGGALELPVGMSDTARENVRQSVQRTNTGAAKAGRLIVLEDGAKFSPFSLSNQDAQWIEGRAFGVQEVARFFSISPTKLADLGRATWSNITAENLSFIENTLRPILIPIEQQARRKLLTEAERKTHYIEAVIEARLRGLTADRYAAYATAINAGIMLPSEARRMENWPAVPGIDDRPRPGTAPGPTPPPDPPKEPSNGNPDPTDPAAV